MIVVALLLVVVIFLCLFSKKEARTSSSNTPLTKSPNYLIERYGSTPKTVHKKVHVIVSLTPNIQNVITNILRQTERADLMTIVVPEQYETTIKNGKDNLCKLVKDTCVVQIAGGYAMLAKERERGTVLLYVKGENAFKDPNTLKRLLMEMEHSPKDVQSFNDAVCVNNSVKIGVNDAYKVSSTF